MDRFSSKSDCCWEEIYLWKVLEIFKFRNLANAISRNFEGILSDKITSITTKKNQLLWQITRIFLKLVSVTEQQNHRY